ncbi:MAG: hypothetical protein Q4D05_06800 [Acinetobacter sp.]|nr:hypothetical protein [Acinetobacter sp.]
MFVRNIVTVVAVTGASLALIACGGKGSETTSTPIVSNPSTSAQAASTQKDELVNQAIAAGLTKEQADKIVADNLNKSVEEAKAEIAKYAAQVKAELKLSTLKSTAIAAGLTESEADAYAQSNANNSDEVAQQNLSALVAAKGSSTTPTVTTPVTPTTPVTYTGSNELNKAYTVNSSNFTRFKPFTDEKLNKIVRADGSGASDPQEEVHDKVAYNIYSNNLSETGIALIVAKDHKQGDNYLVDTMLVTKGKATPYSELSNLKGTVKYTGTGFEAYLDNIHESYGKDKDIISPITIDLTANFDAQVVSGTIHRTSSGYNWREISLQQTDLINRNGGIGFSGIADLNGYKGIYEGKFVGTGAKAFVGHASFRSISSSNALGIVFHGTEIKKQ